MSNEVDQRVVEMKFDNKNFEKNVSTSMSTLKKFKESLKFEGATKGIEDINKEASKFSLNKMEDSASKVEVKFSAMSVAAIAAISRIVDKAMDAGVKLVKSLSVDNIAAGWEKYADKTASVQTIMNATGKSVDEVNSYLDKLMWFSDETSYGFNDMTKAIAQMTSSGGKIERLIPLVTGVANATAFAGKGAMEFSRVMYNLNQSYATGHLQYIDWRSLEMAGVASEQLKTQMIEVAEAIGTINKGDVTIANFSETLKKGWATTEVMEEAFGYFAEMSDLAYKMVRSGEVETASEAYDILSKKYKGVSIQAAKAAQEAKTFREAIDATKDAVGSGWMKTFELVFGNYAEAKKLWTDLANELYDLFAEGGNRRNELFGKAFQTGIQQLRDEGVPDIEMFKIRLLEAAEAAGVMDDATRELANEDFEAFLKTGVISHDMLRDSLLKSVEAVNKYSEAELIAQGYTEDEIAAINDFKKALYSGQISIDEYVDKLSRMSGRENLVQAFWNIWDALFAIDEETGKAVGVISVFKETVGEMFPAMTAERLYDITVKIREFTEKLRLTEEQATTLKKVFTVLLTPLRWAVDLAKEGFKAVGKIAVHIKNLAGRFADLIKRIKPAESILHRLFGDDKAVEIIQAWQNAVSHLKDQFKQVGARVAELWTKFKESDKVQGILQSIRDAFGEIATWISDHIIAALNYIAQLDLVGVVDGIVNGFKSLGEFIKTAFTNMKALFSQFSWQNIGEWFSNFGQMLRQFKMDLLAKFGEDTIIGKAIALIQQGVEKLPPILDGAKTAIKQFTDGLTPGRILIFAFSVTLLTLLINLSKAIKAFKQMTKAIQWVFEALHTKIKLAGVFTKIIVLVGVLVGAIELLSRIPTEGLIKAGAALVVGLGLVLGATAILVNIATKMAAAKNVEIALVAISNTFIRLGAAIALLAASLWIINKVDVSSIFAQLGAFAVLLAEFTGVALVLGRLGKPLGKGAGTLIAIAASMLLLGKAISVIAKLDMTAVRTAITNLVPAVLALTALSAINRLSGGFGNALGITMMIANLFIMIKALKKLQEVDIADLLSVVPQYILLIISLRMLGRTLRKLNGGDAAKGGLGILLIASSLFIIGETIQRLSKLDLADAAKGTGVIAVLMGLMIGIIAVSKLTEKQHTEKMGKSFIAMAVAIGALSICVAALGKLDAGQLVKGTAAVGVMMGMMALIVAAAKNSNKAAGAILSMTVAIAAITAAIGILGIGLDWQELLSASTALSMVMLSFAAALKVISGIGGKDGGPNWNNIQTIGYGLLTMLAMLTMVVVAMRSLPRDLDWQQMLAFGASFSLIALSFAGITKVLSTMTGESSKNAAKGALAMAAIITLVTTTVTLIGLALKNPALQDALQNGVEMLKKLETLGLVLAGATALTAILGLIKPDASANAIVGGAALGLVISEVVATVTLIGLALKNPALQDALQNGVSMLKQLESLGLVIAGATALTAVLGLVNPAMAANAVIAGASMSLVLAEIVGIVTILGTILNNPALKSGYENGLEMLTKIGQALGEFIGKFVGGIVGGIAEASLSGIGDGIAGLFNAIASIDTAGIDNFRSIVDALQEFAKANIMEGLAMFLGCSNSLEEFGQAFEDFAPHLVNASEQLQGIDMTGVQQAADAMKTFGEFLNVLPRQGGLIGTILGDRESLTTLSEGLEPFGKAMRAMVDNLPKSIDQESIESAKNAGMMMTELQKALPKEGGLVQAITGEAGDMSKFASGMSDFATGIVDFQNILTANDFKFKEDLVKNVTNAGKSLAELNNALPATGGVLQDWLGSKDLQNFATDLPWLAQGIRGFQNALTEGGFKFKAGLVDDVTNAAKGLAALNNSLPETGGKLQAWFGGQSLDTFGDNLGKLGDGLRWYYDKVAGMKADIAKNGTDVANELVSVAQKLELIKSANFLNSSDTLDKFGTRISTLGGSLKSFAVNIEGADWNAVSEAVAVLQSMVSITSSLADFDASKTKSLVFAFEGLGFEGLESFTKAFTSAEAEAQITEAGESVVTSLRAAIEGKRDSAMNYAATITVVSFATHFTDYAEARMETAASSFMQITRDALTDGSLTEYLTPAGEFVVAGIQQGIDGAWDQLLADIKTKAQSIAIQFQYSLEIHSPSKVMRDEVGRYIVQGLAEGIKDDMSAEEQAEKKAQNIVNAFQSIFKMHDTDLKAAQLELSKALIENPFWSKGEKLGAQIQEMAKEVEIGKKRLESEIAKFNAVAQKLDSSTVEYKDAQNNLSQAWIDYHSTLQEYANLKATAIEPKLIFKETGENVIEGFLYGISADMSMEDAMAQKAENVIAAFENTFKSHDFNTTLRNMQADMWELANPEPTTKADKSKYDADKKVAEVIKNKQAIEQAADQVKRTAAEYEAIVQIVGEDSDKAREVYLELAEQQRTLMELAAQRRSYETDTANGYAVALAKVNEMTEEEISHWFDIAENNPVKLIYDAALNAAKDYGNITFDYEDFFAPLTDNETLSKIGDGIEVVFEEDIPKTIEGSVDAIAGAANWVGTQTGTEMASSLGTAFNDQITQIFGNIDSGYLGSAANALSSTKQWIQEQLAAGLISSDTAKGWLGSLGDLGKNLKGKAEEAGINVPLGATAGVEKERGGLRNAVEDLGNGAIDTLRGVFDEHSPSKVAEEIGSFFVIGLANGLLKMLYMIRNVGEEIADEAIDSVEDIVLRIDQVLQGDLDFAPSIAPVLDLSGIYESASGLGDVLNVEGSYTLASDAFKEVEAARMSREQSMTQWLVDSIGNQIAGLHASLDDMREVVESHGKNDLIVNIDVDGNEFARATVPDYLLASRAAGTPFYEPASTFK